MTEPTFTPTTERLYARLPEVYREADRRESYTLKRWLSGLVDQQGEVDALIERIDYVNRADRVGEPQTATADVIFVEAESMTRVGPWSQGPTTAPSGVRVFSNGPGPAYLEQEVFVLGGTYRLELNYEGNSDRGSALISVDRDREILLDQYSPGVTTDTTATLFNDLWLARGYHSLRVEWTGLRQNAASDTLVEANRLRLVNVLPNADDTSDLVDPTAADDAWLDWLGQLVGVELDPGMSRVERRDAVRFAVTGVKSGTKSAVAAAAKSELFGSRYVKVFDHSTDAANGVGTAGPFDVLVVTRASETPTGAAVIATIERKGAKPAGVRLYHRAYEASWEIVELRAPTWDDWETVGTWDRIQDLGLAEGLTVANTGLTLTT